MQLDLPYVVLDAFSVLSQFDAVGQDVCNFLRASRNSGSISFDNLQHQPKLFPNLGPKIFVSP